MADFTTVGKVDEFTPGEMRLFQLGESEVIVVRQGDQFYAFDSRCPHAYQPLIEGDVRGQTIACAYHRIVFNMATGAVTFGAAAPLRLHQVRVEGDEVQVGPRKAMPAPRWGER